MWVLLANLISFEFTATPPSGVPDGKSTSEVGVATNLALAIGELVIMDNKSHHAQAALKGKAVEGRIAGALRGGYVFNGMFSASGPVGSFHVQPVSETRELKVFENA
jgi:hypothetical protein